MNKNELNTALHYVDATRAKRTQMAKQVLEQPDLIGPLLEIVVQGEDPISNRASWVLEYVLKRKLSLLIPYLDFFVSILENVQMDSSVRPMAKICEFLTRAFFLEKENPLRLPLTNGHLEAIATACFDWLIGDYKVASKAYSMTSLYLLGTKFEWIHNELRLVLEKDYASGSAAYKARARITLEKLGARK